MNAVGPDFPVGYRFLADEWLPDGLHLEETTLYAKELGKRGLAYLSVMAGTYDSFSLPEYLKEEKKEGYMVPFAARIKEAVPGITGHYGRKDSKPGHGQLHHPGQTGRFDRPGQGLVGRSALAKKGPGVGRRAFCLL